MVFWISVGVGFLVLVALASLASRRTRGSLRTVTEHRDAESGDLTRHAHTQSIRNDQHWGQHGM